MRLLVESQTNDTSRIESRRMVNICQERLDNQVETLGCDTEFNQEMFLKVFKIILVAE